MKQAEQVVFLFIYFWLLWVLAPVLRLSLNGSERASHYGVFSYGMWALECRLSNRGSQV